MSHTPTRWSIKGVVFAASLTIVFAACGGLDVVAERRTAASTAPSTRAIDRRVHRPAG